ncbi:hypothetical protein N2152v2_004776 [Parachlorella kessleri]
MTLGSLTLFKPSAVSGSTQVSKLCNKLLAVLGSRLHLNGTSPSVERTPKAKREQGVTPVSEQPQQSLRGGQAASEPQPQHQGSASCPEDLAPLHATHVPVVKLPAVKTSVHAPTTPNAAGDDHCADGQSPPDSPTDVLHWHRASRAKSMPANAAIPALALRFELALEVERQARKAAEAAAEAAYKDAKGKELEQLQRQLLDAQNMVASLRVVNKELQMEVDKLQSQIPSMEVAYENLKGSFFRLQTMYGGAQARLGAALNQVAHLRSELQAGQPQAQ